MLAGDPKIMESHDETGRPILCINNCGFFGRAETMNMCSKCYKDTLLNKEQDKLAAASVESFVSGGSTKAVVNDGAIDVEVKPVCAEISGDSSTSEILETKVKTGPSRCGTCRKRVGLTGFTCKCGNLFCAMHRYSDKHDCPYDYQAVGRDAIAKSNPVIKADKIDKF